MDASTIFRRAGSENRQRLSEAEVYDILRAVGIDTPITQPISPGQSPTLAIPGERLVLKLVAPTLAHKTDIGGVQTVANTPAAIRVGIDGLSARARAANLENWHLLACECIEIGENWYPACEWLMSIRHDHAFGPVLAVGIGGVWAEWFAREFAGSRGLFQRPTNLLITPEQCLAFARELPAYPLLTGQGRALAPLAPDSPEHPIPATIAKLAALAEQFSAANPDAEFIIEELEINPFRVAAHARADGRAQSRFVAVDGLATIAKAPAKRPVPRPLAKLPRLFRPERVLVVGVSAKAANVGRVILDNLMAAGFPRENLLILHPSAREIAGVRAVPDTAAIAALDAAIDVAVITIPTDAAAIALIGDLIDTGKVHTFIVTSGGFGETENGADLQADLVARLEAARGRDDGGVLLCGPNCLGITSRPGNLDTFFVPAHKAPAGVPWPDTGIATVSQSGAFIAMQRANLRPAIDAVFSVSFGNQIDVTIAEYIAHLAAESNVKTIAAVLEGFRPLDGRRLIEVAQAMRAMGKSLVIYKSARTPAGAVAAHSHTAAIAGDYEVFRAAMREVGAIEAESLAHMDAVVLTLAAWRRRPPTGNRVAVISNAGIECSVALDNLAPIAGHAPLALAEFSPETVAALRAVMPAGVVDIHNPLDITPVTDGARLRQILDLVAADPAVDWLVASPTPMAPFLSALPAGAGHSESLEFADALPRVLADSYRRTPKPMLAVIEGGDHFAECRHKLLAAGVPVVNKIELAMRTVASIAAGWAK